VTLLVHYALKENTN